jgi:hypothetical protein
MVLDAFSRWVVGWSMADHLRTELVLDALDMAIAQRNPTTGLVHHSDHGCQYTSFAFGRRLAASELVASMGTIGDALDNAVAESFFATLECELLDRYPWPTRAGYGRRSSTLSRSSTTANAATRPSTTIHPPSTTSITHQQHLRPNTVSTEPGQLHTAVAGVLGGRPCSAWRSDRAPAHERPATAASSPTGRPSTGSCRSSLPATIPIRGLGLTVDRWWCSYRGAGRTRRRTPASRSSTQRLGG